MKRNVWLTRLACMLLIAGTIAGVAIAVGEPGTQSNPLVTLDYLNKAIEELSVTVDQKIEEKAAELLGEMSASSTFTAVTVNDGENLYLTSGSQMVLRVGTASSTGGILDATEGEITSGTLQENRIYIAMGDDHKITVSGTVTVLVLGEYTIR